MISPSQKKKILAIVSVFETGSITGNYGALALHHDGPIDPATGKKRKQVTFGSHQTTEYGNLKALLQIYCAGYGKVAKELRPYVSKIGVQPLADNQQFLNLLRIAGTCEEMHVAQDAFFDKYYWEPAAAFARANGFTLALSWLVLFDSYIHSGGIPKWLRDDFSEVPPAKGGQEKAWISAYVDARDSWLEGHPDKLLRNTDYRCDLFEELIKTGDWNLLGPAICKYNQADPKKWITIL